MIIADTDVLIDYLSDAGPGADRVASALGHGDLATTVISRFELLAGAKKASRERTILELLSTVPVLSLDAPSADLAAKVRRLLDGQGQSIGMGDSLIAGIVLYHAGSLLTRNRRHFERVDGLRLEEL